MAATMNSVIQALLSNPNYHQLLSILKGFRNGIVYGTKIRFPHALVMTFLFKSGPLKEKLQFILQATYHHATNLAKFVTIYKSIFAIGSKLNDGKLVQFHSFIAAFIGGYIVFGERNPINEQINLYLLSRMIMGLGRLAIKRGLIPEQKTDTSFTLFAGVVWGVVLTLFEVDKGTLQPSLQSSMTYLYRDSNVWTSIWDLLFWNNSKVW